MPDVLDTSDLIAHRKALEAAGASIRLVLRVPAPLKPIAAHCRCRERRLLPAVAVADRCRCGCHCRCSCRGRRHCRC